MVDRYRSGLDQVPRAVGEKLETNGQSRSMSRRPGARPIPIGAGQQDDHPAFFEIQFDMCGSPWSYRTFATAGGAAL
jgi:hypothetical protein